MLCLFPEQICATSGAIGLLVYLLAGRANSNIHCKFSSQISIVDAEKVEGIATALEGYVRSIMLYMAWFPHPSMSFARNTFDSGSTCPQRWHTMPVTAGMLRFLDPMAGWSVLVLQIALLLT